MCVCVVDEGREGDGGRDGGGGGGWEEGVVGRGIELARHGVTFPTVRACQPAAFPPAKHPPLPHPRPRRLHTHHTSIILV